MRLLFKEESDNKIELFFKKIIKIEVYQKEL
jgi:hypothetical protein